MSDHFLNSFLTLICLIVLFLIVSFRRFQSEKTANSDEYWNDLVSIEVILRLNGALEALRQRINFFQFLLWFFPIFEKFTE